VHQPAPAIAFGQRTFAGRPLGDGPLRGTGGARAPAPQLIELWRR